MHTNDTELLRNLARTQSRPQSPREKRIGLIAAMGHFRPQNATPIQFYNYVREFCIMHNCSIDEAMERSPDAWTKLSKDQRQLYNSERHAALPIPVPRHLIYRAIQMERAGRWKISSTPAANGASTKYAVESYAPPVKPTKMQARLRAQLPRYDNLAETSPCCLEGRGRWNGTSQSLTKIQSEVSLRGTPAGRLRVMSTMSAMTPTATATATPVKRLSGGASAPKQQQQPKPKPKPKQLPLKMTLKPAVKGKTKCKKLMSSGVVRKKQKKKMTMTTTMTSLTTGASQAEIKRKCSNSSSKKLKDKS